MKKTVAIAAVALSVLSGLADETKCTCSMHVGNSSAEQTISKGAGASSRSGTTAKSSKTKTVTRTVSWPVSVSIRGEPLPSSDAVKLRCYFFGTTDGKPMLLGEEKLDVTLDEKGNFKTDVSSPTEKLVHTTTKTQTGVSNRRSWWARRHHSRSTSSNTKSTTSGTRVTGCIIQLVVNGKVERAYASNPGWSRFAKSDPIPEDEILNIH